MTEPDPGIITRAENWVQEHIAPDVARVKADVDHIKELAPALEKIASIVVTLAKADPGIPPEVITDVEGAAEIVARVVTELAAAGM